MNNCWIAAPIKESYCGAISFIKEFDFKKEVQSAYLSISAVGLYEVLINNRKVGNRAFTPGFTSYDKRGIQYQKYEVTELLQNNCTLEIAVAPGWAVGHLGYAGNKNIYSDHTACCAELIITYADKSTEICFTDTSFKAYTNQTTLADIYKGETVDKTHTPQFLGYAVSDEVKYALIEDIGEPVTEHESFKARLITAPNGDKILDFGQNMTGYVSLNICGKRGDRVKLSFGEVLDKNGNLYNENYRTADNKITYILSGKEDYFKPRFSFQGFRYARVDEYPTEAIATDGFTAIAVHSDMKRNGYFSCGNPKVNRLYHNIIWGQKSNFLDIPTDCPQRDERLGWTGDAQVFCRTAALNFNVRKFFDKWLADLRAEQGANGEIYGTCPETAGITRREHTRISAGWGDAAVIIPWTLYLQYGDKKLLSDNFDMMRRWVDYMHAAGASEYLWLGGWHYGDWLAIDGGENSYEGATSRDLIASAFFAYSVKLTVLAGDELKQDVSKYRELYLNIIKAFRKEYLTPILSVSRKSITENDILGGKITQTALVLILEFGLCEKDERKELTDILVRLIEYFDGKMSTGFIGTPYILHTLSDNGRRDMAYKLLLNEKVPSWLYSVNKGATTVWEHWDGIKEDGSFWSSDMNSFNHYAYGAVGAWLYEAAAGIKVKKPGYEEIEISPEPSHDLGYINCSLETPYGSIISNWKYESEKIEFDFSVPSGVSASIKLPDGFAVELRGPAEYKKEISLQRNS